MACGFFLFFKNYLPKKLFAESTAPSQHVVVDSLMLEALQKEAALQNSFQAAAKDSLEEVERVSTESEQEFKGLVYLDSFYAVLEQMQSASKGAIRIAYFGDSMTDGDMIVQDLRTKLQQQYGGSGVGFVGVISESANSRGSITHKFSTNWKTQSYLNVKQPLFPFGVNGQVSFVKDSLKPAWVSFKAGLYQNTKVLPNAVLYYGKSNNKNGSVRWISGMDTIVKLLQPEQHVNQMLLAHGGLKEWKVEFVEADSIPIYGFDFSSGVQRVQVDNFSSRGNSGLPLSLLKPNVMQQFQKTLNYDLIVLHYGTNVLNYGSYQYGWYTKQMTRVVDHLRICFPKAAILVVSTADKSTKYDLIMQTDSAVMPLVRAQRQYAMDKKTAFFNLYEAMGGHNAMVTWVEGNPVKANKDYTHFNYRGAQEVGTMLYDFLEQGYHLYQTGDLGILERKAAVESDAEEIRVRESVSGATPAVQKEEVAMEKSKTIGEPRSLDTTKITKAESKPKMSKDERYIIQEGDTFHALSQRFGVTIQDLKEANGLHGDALIEGWKIKIPARTSVPSNTTVPAKEVLKKPLENQGVEIETSESDSQVFLHEVQEGETLSSIARKFKVSVRRLKNLNNLEGDGIEIEQMIRIPYKN